MDRQNRIEKIQQIIETGTPFLHHEIQWEDQLQIMPVYKIPLTYLIYNKYNGRILSRTKSLERQNHNIDLETNEGKKVVEDLLWESRVERNKKTLKELDADGQKKIGIITKDGIIIDGNRRAMLLNKLKQYDYFKAVILPVSSEDANSIIEIQKLETSFQMGEDEKLGYNATEKYLKARELYDLLKVVGGEDEALMKISDWMGEDKGVVESYLAIMKVMDEYLEVFEYSGIYTQLDKREDLFINLTKWLNAFYGEQSQKPFNNYKDIDVDCLKMIAFDYIRARYEGKEFRMLAEGLRTSHFFGNQELWNSFSGRHSAAVQDLNEDVIDYDSKNIEQHLNGRDSKFIDKLYEGFKDNIEHHERVLKNKQAQDQPEKLVIRAIDSFNAINQKNTSFGKDDVQRKIMELAQMSFKSLESKSPLKVLSIVLELLNDLNIEQFNDSDFEKASDVTRDIQRILNGLRRDIG